MKKKRKTQRPILTIPLITLTTLFGLQLMRVLVPQFLFILRDRFGWDTLLVGGVALLVFLSAFLAGPINRFLGSFPAFMIVSFAIGFTRLAIQFWTFDPLGDMILAGVGTIAFLIFLPLTLGLTRRAGETGTTSFGLSLLLAILIDLAINGAALSYDLAWQTGWLPALVVSLLVIDQLYFIWQLMKKDLPNETADAPFSIATTWVFFGPYLFIQFLVFANIAWVASTTGWPFPVAFAWLLLCHLAGLTVFFLQARYIRLVILITAVITMFLQVYFFITGAPGLSLVLIYLLAGQIAFSGLLAAILKDLGRGEPLPGLARITTIHGLSMLLMVIFLFVYYAAYDLPLPIDNQILALTALIIILLAGIKSILTATAGFDIPATTRKWLPALLLLLILPLALWITQPRPAVDNLGGQSLRLMTYNLHNGFDPKGHLGLEALAQVIERENPDVVGLQEVSRGWVVNGSTDTLAWLERRLGMRAIYDPTADAQWGNAVLTNLPVLAHENYPLPTEDLLIQRGYIYTKLDRGNGKFLDFIDTHYHHRADGSEIRVLESQTLLDFWAGKPGMVIVGDMNAEHGDPEIDMLVAAGLVDVLDATGLKPGYTNPVPGPDRRIDYLWSSADLQPGNPSIPPDEASDHLAVAVDID